jgi:hypothetical protein
MTEILVQNVTNYEESHGVHEKIIVVPQKRANGAAGNIRILVEVEKARIHHKNQDRRN